MLPLSGVVAFAGSRHGSPFPAAPVVRAVLEAGGVVRVGCARGVDAAVRAVAPDAVTLEAKNFPGVATVQLAARTRAVVAGAHALVLFPPGSGVLGPGSTLALECALNASIPVWGVCRGGFWVFPNHFFNARESAFFVVLDSENA
jgi:hypothetical protein